MTRISTKRWGPPFKEAVIRWVNDNGTLHCAALSYYTLFSVSPLVILTVAISGIFFGESESSHRIFEIIRQFAGSASAESIQSLVQGARHMSAKSLEHRGIAASIGIFTLIFGASGVFLQLEQSLNLIWGVRSQAGRSLKNLLRQRIISFMTVLVTGVAFLGAFLLTVALTAIEHRVHLPHASLVWHAAGWLVPFALLVCLCGGLLKVLPDVELSWKDAWAGASVTSFLFLIGNFLIGLYLTKSGMASAYGAAGSLIVMLTWVFYSSAIFIFGAEFTHVYATRDGRKVRARPGCEYVT